MPVSRVTTNISGQTWLSGAGAPASTLGYATQYYLDTASGNVYQKTNATTWVVRGDIVAPIVEGVWHSGSGAPDGSLGSEQDFYLDEDTGEIYEKTAPAAWTLRGDITPAPSGFFVLPDGAILTGTYDGSVVVNGNATYNNTVVKGDLRLSGSLTPVNPTSTIEVGGEFRANTAYFGDNTRAAPSPIINGDIIVQNLLNIYGNSIFIAKSITQTNPIGLVKLNCETEIYGDFIAAGQVVLTEINGGRSLICGGDFITSNDVNGAGFDAPFRLGGVQLTVAGNLRVQNLDLAALADGGGSGGNLYCGGDASILAFTANGADNLTGAGGDGGTLSVKGNMECSSVTLYGGQGLSGGAGGTLDVRGDFQCSGDVYKYGGAGTDTLGGYANPFICGGNASLTGNLDNSARYGFTGNVGGGIAVGGNLIVGGLITTSGGNGQGAQGGNGGVISVNGDLIAYDRIVCEGGQGNDAASGHGGSIVVGGTLKVEGDANNTAPVISTRGGPVFGTGSTVATSGNGGNITVGKSLLAVCFASGAISKVLGIVTNSQGVTGLGVTTFSSGNGGSISVGQNLEAVINNSAGNTRLSVHTHTAQPDTLMGGDGATGGDAGNIMVGGNLICGDLFAFGGSAGLCAAGKGGNLDVGGDCKTTQLLLLSAADSFGNDAGTNAYKAGGNCTVGGSLSTGRISLSGSASGSITAYQISCGDCSLESRSGGNISGSVTAYSNTIMTSLVQRGGDNAAGAGGDAAGISIRGNFTTTGVWTRSGGAGNGGNGGNVQAATIYGNCNVGGVAAWEGGGAGTQGAGGTVFALTVHGNARFNSNFTRQGGTAAGNASGGPANGVDVGGNLMVGGIFRSTGGQGSGTGSGGSASGGTVRGTSLFTSGVQLVGGTGGATGAGGGVNVMTLYGSVNCNATMTLTGGNGGATNGAGGAVSLPTFYSAALVSALTATGGSSTGQGGGTVIGTSFYGPIYGGTWSLTGGNSAGANQSGGGVTGCTFYGPVRIANFNITGGNGTNATGGMGGATGAINFEGFFRGNVNFAAGNSSGVGMPGGTFGGCGFIGGAKCGSVTFKSGNGSVAGTHNGGGLYSGTYDSVTITDGTGTASPTPTVLYISGNVVVGALTTPNRTNMQILHDSAGGVVFKVRSLVGRSIFRNANGTDTADQTASYTTRLYSCTSTAWNYTTLTAA